MQCKKKIKAVIIIMIMILCAIISRMIVKFNLITSQARFLFSILRSLIYIFLIIAWGISIVQRILKGSVRNHLLAIDGLLLFWMVIRTLKYLFLAKIKPINCYCWYAFYIPMLLVPIMGIFIACSLGETPNYKLPKKIRLLYIPNIVLIIIILTNNIHEFVFRFSKAGPSSDVYTYGSGYILSVIWIAVEIIAFIFILFRKSHVPGKKKRILIPVIPIFIAILYAICYIIHIPIIYIIAGDMTVVFILIMIAVCEACIQCGLIPANEFYEELFQASTIGAMIVDEEYHIYYQSDSAKHFESSIMKKAETMPIDLGNERLMSTKIKNGHVLWLDDVSKIKEILIKLEHTKNELSNKNEILESEVALEEKRIQAQEQARLYDKIAKKVQPQLEILENLLDSLANRKNTRKQLAKICVISAYIKRFGNLILLGEDANYLPSQELELCIKESIENLKLLVSGISFNSQCDGLVLRDDMLNIYASFEMVIENVMDCIHAMLINLKIKNGFITLKINLSCDNQSIQIAKKDLSKIKLKYEISTDDQDHYIMITNKTN